MERGQVPETGYRFYKIIHSTPQLGGFRFAKALILQGFFAQTVTSLPCRCKEFVDDCSRLDTPCFWFSLTMHTPESLTGIYWNNRYAEANTPWDLGSPSPPLVAYLQTLTEPERSQRMLVLGGGAGHDIAWLHANGFPNAYHVDFAPLALQTLRERYPHVPEDRLLLADFFSLAGPWDLLLEQTFYCALHPSERDRYVQQCAALLRPGGLLAGVWFNFPLTEEGPPFGGSEEEYRNRLAPYFDILKLEPCSTSVKPRLGRELWIEARRR